MYIPKRYGQGKVDRCPFCDKQAITRNAQKVPVCAAHGKFLLPPMKCMCGETLDMLHGKYGIFFSCMKHGNMNLRKALEINPVPMAFTPAVKAAPSSASSSTPARKMDAMPERKKERGEIKEITVTSEELEWMF